MTIQVGMVGADGIVLASDKRWIRTKPYVTATDASKLVVSEEKGIAIACARNLELSIFIAKDIVSMLRDDQWEFPGTAIEKIAAEHLKNSSAERRDAQCLIVFTKPTWRLFFLEMGMMEGQTMPLCLRQDTKVVAGDNLMSSVFFSERYYERRRTTRELLPLAAQLIYGGHKLNPLGIDGLEMLVCDDKGLHRVSDGSVRQFWAAAAHFDETLASLLSSAQEFSYAPNVIR